MKKNNADNLALMDSMGMDEKDSAIILLSDDIKKTGNSWMPVTAQVPGAHHAMINGKLFASDGTGLAEAYLANWVRQKNEESCTPATLFSAQSLTDDQRIAAEKCLTYPVTTLSGLPGTGKTYTAKVILQSLEAAGYSVGGCAYTGAAAQRLAASTGYPCSTIHRLLRHNGTEFTADVPYDCLLVDESSFLSNGMLLAIASRMSKNGRLVLMGDPDQLYGIEPGRIFEEMTKIVPHTHLTQVLRTAEDSPIGLAAAQVLKGLIPESMISPKGKGGFMLLQCDSLTPKNNKLPRNHPLTVAVRFSELEGIPVSSIRTMCTTNKMVELINNQFDNFLNIKNPPYMITKNLSEEGVYNGEIGLLNGNDGNRLLIKLSNGREVLIPASYCRQAWGLTVHKSQGDGYVASQMICEKYTTRRALYTAITRGISRVALNCTIETLKIALNNIDISRTSLLTAFYRGEAQLLEGPT